MSGPVRGCSAPGARMGAHPPGGTRIRVQARAGLARRRAIWWDAEGSGLGMSGYGFTFHGERLEARASGVLWWATERTLIVRDLHFGKAQRMALCGGGLLPPYEMRETLARLDAEISLLDPAVVIALGDSFDDPGAEARLLEADAAWLARLMAGRVWLWIAGNHDPGPVALGGSLVSRWQHRALSFRHIAQERGEISGHFHPKARVAGVARPCFLVDADRVILPAFGAFTGGLDCRQPPLSDLMGADALAVLTGTRARAVPMPR